MGQDSVDPADLPDVPWRSPALVQPGVTVTQVALPVRAAAAGGLSLEANLDAALADDHTEDTPATAIPGHFGYTAEALVARLMEEDEAKSLGKPLIPLRGKGDAAASEAAPVGTPVVPVQESTPEPAHVAPAVKPAAAAPAAATVAASAVAVPLWAVAATFFVIGLMAGCLLTLFVVSR